LPAFQAQILGTLSIKPVFTAIFSFHHYSSFIGFSECSGGPAHGLVVSASSPWSSGKCGFSTFL